MSDLYRDEYGMPLYAERALPDGRKAIVYPLTFGRARLSISPPGDELSFEVSY